MTRGRSTAEAVVFAVIIVMVLAFLFDEWRDCSARDGMLVRNAFGWPTCIKAERVP